MEISILAQGKDEEPQLTDVPLPLFDLTHIPKLTTVVIEGAMASGEPAVIIACSSRAGTVMLSTSLDKFLMAAKGMAGMAETLWGWKMPEGYATLVTSDLSDDQKRAILESIKSELEGQDPRERTAEELGPCSTCGHSFELHRPDVHSHDDADNHSATDPDCPFRCRLCDCPNYTRSDNG